MITLENIPSLLPTKKTECFKQELSYACQGTIKRALYADLENQKLLQKDLDKLKKMYDPEIKSKLNFEGEENYKSLLDLISFTSFEEEYLLSVFYSLINFNPEELLDYEKEKLYELENLIDYFISGDEEFELEIDKILDKHYFKKYESGNKN